MTEGNQVALELMFVNVTLQVAPEQLVVQLITWGQCVAIDGVQASEEIPILHLPLVDGLKALVGPLVVVATIAE